jgi:hypothetical protein
MCNPTLAQSLALGGGLLQAGTQYQQARYASTAERMNAAMSNEAAQAVAIQGAAQQAEILRQGRQIEGAQRVALAGANVGGRVARDILSDTSAFTAADAEAANTRAGAEAQALRTRAADQGARSRTIGRYAPWEAGSTILTGAARAYGIRDRRYDAWDR